MGTIRKVGGKYRVEVRRGSFYRSGNFETRTLAKAAESRFESEYLIRKERGFEPHPLGEAIVRYVNEESVKKKGYRWEHLRANAFLRDYPELCTKAMHEITESDMTHWAKRRMSEINQTTGQALSPSTINRELNFWSAVWQIAVSKWKWTDVNVIRSVHRPKNPPPRDRRISNNEIDQVLNELNRDKSRSSPKSRALARMFLLAIETAMRLNELCTLTRENLYLDGNFVRLSDTKNGDSRDVPLSKEALRLIQEQLSFEHNPIFNLDSGTASRMFAVAIKNIGIIDLHFHDTRHEAITRLARKIDVLDLARMVGHRDINSLRTYYNATASEIASRLG